MIYEYKCFGCKRGFDVIKPVKDYDKEETCEKCGAVADRVPFPRRTYLSGTAVQDKYFNHALGTVCTDKEAKILAKNRGMIEVGNEDVSKHVNPVESNYDDVWQGA